MNRAAQTARDKLTDYYQRKHGENLLANASCLIRQIDARRSWNSPSQLAAGAWRLLSQIRIDVDDFVEYYVKATLRIEPLESLDALAGGPVLGCADTRHRIIRICVRTLVYEPIFRATAMHEAGHILLHQATGESLHAFAPTLANRSPQEREADDFMVASVLPWEAVQLSVATSALTRGLEPADAFRGIDTPHGRNQWHKIYLPELQARMGVSKHLAALRLRKRGVMSESTLQYHLSQGSPAWSGRVSALCSKHHISHALKEWLDSQ